MDYRKLLEQKQKELKENKTGDNTSPVRFSISKDPNRIAKLYDNKLVLSFPYDSELIAKIKLLPNRKYNPENKQWIVKSGITSYQSLEDLGFTFDRLAQQEYETLINKMVKNEYKPNKDRIANIKTPDELELREYQKQVVDFIEYRNGKAIIALEQGLGKSPCTCTYIYNNSNIKPIVIVVPSSLKYNWLNELNKWAPGHKIEILEGRKTSKLNKKETDIVIINYDILSDWSDELKKLAPELLVIDESQYIKAISNVKRVKAIKSLAKKCKRIIALSGTPVINKSADLYNIISMCEPTLFSNFYDYGNRYCDPQTNQWGTTYNGSSNTEELNTVLSNIMIRYKKEDVLKELPPKIYSYIPLDLDNRIEYDKAENDFIEYIREHKGNYAAVKASYAEQLSQMSTLRQLCAKGIVNDVIKYVKDRLETNSNEKIIIFGVHKEIINTLVEAFKDICVKIDGSVDSNIRQDIVDKFNNNDIIRLFVGNITACGTGLNLQRANTVLFVQLPWTQAALSQAEDRAHRYTTDHTINVIYCLGKDSIEEKLANIITNKANVANQIVDGNFNDNESNSVKKLIENYMN